MKRFIFTAACAVIAACTISAQPDFKKAAKAIFTVKTFSADGNMIGSANGFFTGTEGEAVSSLSLFKGAAKAVVIDAQGKEAEVACILGADDMYDVIKFRVAAKRTTPLAVATEKQGNGAKEGTAVWLVPYSVKKTPSCPQAQISKAEKFNTDYNYYTIALEAPDNSVGCPFVNEQGEAIGMMQQPAKAHDPNSFAVSAGFAAGLQMKGLSINDPVLKSTTIKKDLPDDLNQAILTMYVAAASTDSAQYAGILEDFIRKFPDAPDGYTYRAQINANANRFDQAAKDMEQAIKVADKKDDVHYNYARIIYQKEIGKADIAYPAWSLDKAAKEADEAYRINPIPAYRQLKAQIQFAQKDYDGAYRTYEEIIGKGTRTAEIFYEASRCKEATGDTAAVIALLDSAVNTFSKPYLKAAAPYIIVRAQALVAAGRYRQAVADYNDYESLMSTSVNDNFYYLRAQAEMDGHMYQQALNDIVKAISMNPEYTLYYAEKASLEVRVGLLDEAMASAWECIRLDANLSDGYLFLGLAQCLKGDKAAGVANLKKAKELGDPQADAFIGKYSAQ